MKYLEFSFSLTPPNPDFADVLEAVLADVGFDSFVKDTDALVSPADARGATGDVVFTQRTDLSAAPAANAVLRAYIPAADYDAAALRAALDAFPIEGVAISFEQAEAENKDWNAEWERNYFTPLCVDGRCTIRATFHHDVPPTDYNIVINPRMSFGSGHHETTAQMLHQILDTDFFGKDVLDMGCGTSILAILAAMRGARRVTAIDVDEWCVDNSRENCQLNGIANVDVLLGDAALLAPSATSPTGAVGPFDVILANIHLNIIVRDLPAYVGVLRSGGLLLTSGFYRDDLPRMEAAAAAHGLRLLRATDRNRWCCAVFVKA